MLRVVISASGELLYNIELNIALWQHREVEWQGKGDSRGRGHIYIIMTDSCWGTAEGPL